MLCSGGSVISLPMVDEVGRGRRNKGMMGSEAALSCKKNIGATCKEFEFEQYFYLLII